MNSSSPVEKSRAKPKVDCFVPKPASFISVPWLPRRAYSRSKQSPAPKSKKSQERAKNVGGRSHSQNVIGSKSCSKDSQITEDQGHETSASEQPADENSESQTHLNNDAGRLVLQSNEEQGTGTGDSEQPADENTESQTHLNNNVDISASHSQVTQKQIEASGSNDGASHSCSGAGDQINDLPNQNYTEECNNNGIIDLKIVKLEKENDILRNSLAKLNRRIGDEYLSDCSAESVEFEDGPPVIITTNYQLDNVLAPNHFYICNVSLVDFKSFLI